MRRACVRVHGRRAGVLEELARGSSYRFRYDPSYDGPPVSLTLPLAEEEYAFDRFPPFFDGLLPEGFQLDALLRQSKIDVRDHLGQLMAVGRDLVGVVTVEQLPEEQET